tara:strand:- start:1012 stop:1713 length:702 start_codon:yes stop_codon:yes gene_type:complete
MNFDNKLIPGLLIKRYKRFFADVRVNNQILTVHCPNTGSMHGLLDEGNKVWISKSNNPKRKLKYTLEIIEVKKTKVGINTHSTNKIVHDALQNNLIKEFNNNMDIKPETKFGANTRFDFLVSSKKYQSFIEVKNVTLSRKRNLAEFPDAETLRGLKHIRELIKASKKKFKVYILFVIQRNDCNAFSIAKDIDPNYANAISKAVKNNLKILCYDCKFSPKGIKLNRQIKFILNE